jgi:uncharacterized 2Fe-2S/4Fe-4S cluster protein (DUF4445 family)
MAESEPTSAASVDLQPTGRRALVRRGTTILEAAQVSGVELVAICGGNGTCGSCRVRHVAGELSAPNSVEEDLLTEPEVLAGIRLACQARALGDVRVDIPPESLTALQRLQVEGQAIDVTVDPPVPAYDVVIEPPVLRDLRSDASRLIDALAQAQVPAALLGVRVLRECSDVLREQHWRVRVAVNRARPLPEVVAILPSSTVVLGLAVDVGTTKVAGYLVDLATGHAVARSGAMNPQIAYGEDVVSRITYANSSPTGARVLHDRVVEGINRLVDELCAQAKAHRTQIVDAVVVGNTAMHHLVVGLPVRQLGEAPYVASVSEPLDLFASDVGIQLAPASSLYLPPNIAGYVGADHVSMLLATGVCDGKKTVLAMDIGTNTEISLAHGGELWTCSTASGPAFEGAHIHDGMRAVPGAIERVRYHEGGFLVHAIGEMPPVGLCGSGILDAVAEGVSAGIIDSRGALSKTHPLVYRASGGLSCLLVPARLSGHGRDVVFTRSDVNEIQLAKGAIRTGADLLLRAAGIEAGDVQEVVVAGAFGTYLDIGSAVRIGMLPDLPRERFRQVGNAAGQGAQHMLISRERRAHALEIARRSQYIELTTHVSFTDTFVQSLSL